MMSVVDNEIRFGDALRAGRLRSRVGFAADALVAVLAVDHRLTVFELEDVLLRRRSSG